MYKHNSFFKAIKGLLPQTSSEYFTLGVGLSVILVFGKVLSFLWKILLLRENVSLVGQIEVFQTSLGLVTALCTVALPAAFSRFSLQKPPKTAAYFSFSLLYSAKLFLLICIASVVLFFTFPAFLTHVYVIPVGFFLLAVALASFHEFILVFLNIRKKFVAYGLGRYFWIPLLKIIFLFLIFQKILSENFLFTHVVWAHILAVGLTSVIVFLLQKKEFSLFLHSLLFQKRKNFSTILKNAPPLFQNFTFSYSDKKFTSFSMDKKEQKTFLSYSLLLSGSFVAYIIYGSLDVYLLSYFMGSFFVGIYAALFMGVNILELLFASFLQTFQVHLAEKKHLQAQKNFTQKTARTLFLWGILCCLPLTGILVFFMKTLVPINFLFTVSIFLFLLAKVMQSAFVHIYRLHLDYQGEQVFTFQTMTLSLGVKIILGGVGVYLGGIFGLALTQYVTEQLHTWFLWKKLHR